MKCSVHSSIDPPRGSLYCTACGERLLDNGREAVGRWRYSGIYVISFKRYIASVSGNKRLIELADMTVKASSIYDAVTQAKLVSVCGEVAHGSVQLSEHNPVEGTTVVCVGCKQVVKTADDPEGGACMNCFGGEWQALFLSPRPPSAEF